MAIGKNILKNPSFVVCWSFKKFFTKLIICCLIVIGKNPLIIYTVCGLMVFGKILKNPSLFVGPPKKFFKKSFSPWKKFFKNPHFVVLPK